MAIDAKTGHQIWKTKVEYPPETPRIVCCGIINRGVALYDGKVFRTTLDANVVALDAKTGKIKWYYQFTPNDPFDYDSVAEMVLADINVKGKPTKVVMDANRNGFFYVIDRTNGKLLMANAYVKVNWADGIDLTTGRPKVT